MDEKKRKWEKPELIDLYSITLKTTGAGVCTNGSYDSDGCVDGTKAGVGCIFGTGAAGDGNVAQQNGASGVGACNLGHGAINLPNRIRK